VERQPCRGRGSLVAQGMSLHNAIMGGLKRYTIWLFNRCGESAGIESVIFTDDQLRVARRTYRQAIEEKPDRLIMLCDRSTVLARSDRGKAKKRQRAADGGQRKTPASTGTSRGLTLSNSEFEFDGLSFIETSEAGALCCLWWRQTILPYL
jgi:hypothetical protein